MMIFCRLKYNIYHYNPTIINENIIINEPNLLEQPKYYMNTEWFDINPTEIVNIIKGVY